jgi:hypothetical protein
MSDAALMLRELSEPWASGERVKSAINRAAHLASLSYWRTFDLWYRKARRVEHYELEQIAEALRIKNERAARNEFHELKIRLARLEASLSTRDPDFHSPSIDYARDMVRAPGGKNRALDR